MNRYVAIAIVWLLPPLLLLAYLAVHWAEHLRAYWLHIFAVFATAAAVAGATAAATAHSDPLKSPFRSGVIILLTFAPIASILTAHSTRSSPLAWLVWPSVALFGAWLASMPLWTACLFWRPNASVFSLRFAGLAIACALPFAFVASLFILSSGTEFSPPPSPGFAGPPGAAY